MFKLQVSNDHISIFSNTSKSATPTIVKLPFEVIDIDNWEDFNTLADFIIKELKKWVVCWRSKGKKDPKGIILTIRKFPGSGTFITELHAYIQLRTYAEINCIQAGMWETHDYDSKHYQDYIKRVRARRSNS